MSRENRKSRRVRKRIKVVLSGRPVFTTDISLGGFSVELMQVLPPGTAIDGSLTIGVDSFPFSGEVVWAKAGVAQLGLRGRMGIRFKSVTEGLRTALESFSGPVGNA
jgi:hypothetical protein